MTERRRAASGVIAELLVIALLVTASALTLGAPNLGLAVQLLGGAYPTVASAIALCSVICYAVVALAAATTLVRALRSGAGPRARGRSLRAAACIAVGAALLALSLTARAQVGGGICCAGGARQAQEAAALAR